MRLPIQLDSKNYAQSKNKALSKDNENENEDVCYLHSLSSPQLTEATQLQATFYAQPTF